MSVVPIKLATIIGVTSAIDNVVNICGKSQFFHPDDALSFYSKTNKFVPFAEKNKFKEPLKKIKDIAATAGQPLEFVNVDDFSANFTEINNYIEYLSKKLDKMLLSKKDITAKINDYKKAVNQIKPFIGLNIDLEDISKCKYIKARFGRLPRESYLKLSSYEDNPYVLFFPCTSNKDYCWGVYFSPAEYKDEVDRIFAGLYFERMIVSEQDGTPESKLKNIQTQIEKEEAALQDINKKIDKFWNLQKDQCMRFYTRLEELCTYDEIKGHASKYHDNFILVGWIPQDKELEFTQQLDKIYGIEYSIDRADSDKKHIPPVKLKNNWFSKPFEIFTSMYGLPGYREIDPTLFVAITYTLMYGIMFGDLGHGIVLALFGAIMWRLKRFSLGPIMVRCGVASSMFGILYGSVFGYEHLLDPFYQKVFGLKGKPIDVMAPDTIIKVIIAAVALGVILIVTAMLLKIYSALKQRDLENALFGQNGVAGLAFYVSLIVGVVCQIALGIKILTPVYILCLIVLPLVLIFLKEPLGKLVSGDPNWKPESIGEYILQTFFEMFAVLLEYVSNTMSFLRVGAYVLVHAGLMMAVFIIANMFSGTGSIIAVVFGNLFVIAMEGLLVGIQVLRLEFYEMFSRFFNGEGNEFTPIIAPNILKCKKSA